MTTSDSSFSGIHVSLSNVELWQKFYPVNEMVVLKSGRKLFPELEVKIEGLVPDALYTVLLYLDRVNNIKYRFIKDKLSGTGVWEEDLPVKQTFPIEKKQHMDGGMVGAHWMKSPVSFSHIRITNNSNFENTLKINPIFVQSMHKYQPVVILKRMDNGFEEEFRLTMTEFMAVTSYQNPQIVELKKQNNKFCSGFLPEGKHYKRSQENTPRGRKRAIAYKDSNSNQPSTVASLNGTPASLSSSTRIVSPLYKKPMHFQNQSMTPAAIAMTPSSMLTPPSLTSTPTGPPFGGHNNFQNQMMTPANIVTPPLLASTSSNYMTPPFGGSTGFQNQTMTPPSLAPTYMTPPSGGSNGFQNQMTLPPYPAHQFDVNQHYDAYGMSSMSQMGGAPMAQATHWGMSPSASHSQNFTQPENTGNMPQMIQNPPQYLNYNGSGTNLQYDSNGANYNFRF
ncbi:unnamed protein product [Caenorhabditis brenneri]